MSRAMWLFAITAASAIATLATPYGIGTWRAVIHALLNPHAHTAIVDWLSLPASLLFHWRLHQVGNVAYQFLCYYRIVESLKKRRTMLARDAKKNGNSYTNPAEV